MKSSIAAPFLQEFRVGADRERIAVSALMAARTFSAVPTGTVDLVMTTLGVVHVLPMVSPREHVLAGRPNRLRPAASPPR
jgi:hypothetical protein